MKKYFKPTLVVTALTFLSQVVSFLVQAVIARQFGARSAMDAYWIGVTLPQYVISVCIQSVGLVFLPVFVSYFETGDEPGAWRVAISLLLWITVILGGLVSACMVFAKTLILWTAPGINFNSLEIAVKVARWTWPTVVIMSWTSLLAYLYQARHAFAWQAFVPFLGAVLNLVLLLIFARSHGVMGVAMAATISMGIQVILLAPILISRLPSAWAGAVSEHKAFEVLRLALPLIISGFFVRWTPVVDRYLASKLPEGVVSHLGYAFRINGVLSVLISVGLTTVVFPKLAASSARNDMDELLRILSLALRTLWLFVAPVIFLGSILVIPALTVLFQRGAFHAGDSHDVGRLLQIYLLSLGAACLGNITGRVYYALKKIKILAIVGPIEALAYGGYAYLLASAYGPKGIAFSYVIYFNLSLVWQLAVLRYLLGPLGAIAITKSFLRTAFAGGMAAVAVWFFAGITSNVWIQSVVGGCGGLGLYIAALHVLRSPEWELIRVEMTESVGFPTT